MARHPSCCALRSVSVGSWTALLVVAAAALAPSRAGAQQYKEIKPRLAVAQWNVLRTKIQTALRAPTPPTPQDIKDMDEGFLGYYFPAMTSMSADNLATLAQMRKDLFVQYINVKSTPQARDAMLALTMKAMGPISAGAYHPAVRYNAVLILGQLDQQAGTTGSGATPPKPLPAGTNALEQLLELDAIKGVPVPSSIKMAALIGLDRHTRFGIDPQYAEKITAAALVIANRTAPPEDIGADVNSWMRCLAARVLANQFAKGFTPPVHQAFVGMIGGKDMELDDRCKVAEMLASAMYEGAKGVDAGEMADALGKLANAVMADERKKAEEYQEEMVGGSNTFVGGGGGFGGRRDSEGGGFVNPLEDKGPHFERRRTLDRLAALITSATQLGGATSGDVKPRMVQLVTPIKEAADKIVKKETTELDVADVIVQLADTIDGIVSGWAAGGAAPAGDVPAREAPADAAAAPADPGAADAGF
jgi:hypothetical protein